jgi:hypothetical protein
MNQKKLGRGFWPRRALAFVVLLAASSPSPSIGRKPQYPEANLVKANTPAGHPYLAGGISFYEKQAMEQASAPYNLRLFFGRTSGVLASQIWLLIATNDGSRVEEIAVRAPSFFIRLPPGSYTILARFARRIVIVRDIHLREGGKSSYFLRGD